MDRIDCTKCGALLVKKITERGVTPVDSDVEVPFRRTTDFVMCPACATSYPVRDLAAEIQAAARAEAAPAQETNADVITLLERMAQRRAR